MNDADRLARDRFAMLNIARFAGVALVFLGMAIWVGDVARVGGWPVVGVPIFLSGVAATLFGPRTLARRWRSPTDT